MTALDSEPNAVSFNLNPPPQKNRYYVVFCSPSNLNFLCL